MKKESIKLPPSQRQSIEQILNKGKALAWTLKHAQVLLKVDRGPQGSGWSTSQIVEAYDVSRSTVERLSFAVLSLLGPRNAKGMEKPKHHWSRCSAARKRREWSVGVCGWCERNWSHGRL